MKSPEASELRWFVLPSEAMVALTERGAGTEPGVIENNEARPCVPLRGKVAENGVGEVGLQRKRLSGFEKFARAQQAVLLLRQPQATFQVQIVLGPTVAEVSHILIVAFVVLRQPQATFQVQIVLGPTVTEVSQLVSSLPSWCCGSRRPPSGFRHPPHKHTRTHAHTRMHPHNCTCMYVHTDDQTCMHACMHTCTHTCMHACIQFALHTLHKA